MYNSASCLISPRFPSNSNTILLMAEQWQGDGGEGQQVNMRIAMSGYKTQRGKMRQQEVAWDKTKGQREHDRNI